MWLQHVVVSDKHIELVETDCFRGIQVWRILQALNTTLARLAFNLANNTFGVFECSMASLCHSVRYAWFVMGSDFPGHQLNLYLKVEHPRSSSCVSEGVGSPRQWQEAPGKARLFPF